MHEAQNFKSLNVRQSASIAFLLDNISKDVTSRKTYPVHATGSGIIFDTALPGMLLVHHGFLDKWLFPGGHLDLGETTLQAAVRELIEETGIDVSEFETMLFDVDAHRIPANEKKDERDHWHCDFRYLFSGTVDRSLVNCELMLHSDNNKKKTASSISYADLVEAVDKYDGMMADAGYPAYQTPRDVPTDFQSATGTCLLQHPK